MIKLSSIIAFLLFSIITFAQVDISTMTKYERDSVLRQEFIEDSILKVETQLLLEEQDELNKSIELLKEKEIEEERLEMMQDSSEIETHLDTNISGKDSAELIIYYEVLKNDSLLKKEQKLRQLDKELELERNTQMEEQDSIQMEAIKLEEEKEDLKKQEEREDEKLEEEKRAEQREKEKDIEEKKAQKEREEEEKRIERKRAEKAKRNKELRDKGNNK